MLFGLPSRFNLFSLCSPKEKTSQPVQKPDTATVPLTEPKLTSPKAKTHALEDDSLDLGLGFEYYGI